MARVTKAENASRSTASAAPAGTRVASAARMTSDPSAAHLLFEQADRVVELVTAQRVAAHQLREAVALMNGGPADRPHLVQRHRHAARRRLPRGLAAGEPSAYDSHTWHESITGEWDVDVHRAAPRTKPIGVSLQNAAQGPKATWGDEVGPRVPPTAPWSRVLPACVSGDASVNGHVPAAFMSSACGCRRFVRRRAGCRRRPARAGASTAGRRPAPSAARPPPRASAWPGRKSAAPTRWSRRR